MLKDILPDIAFIVYHKNKNNHNSATKIYNGNDCRGIQIYIYMIIIHLMFMIIKENVI